MIIFESPNGFIIDNPSADELKADMIYGFPDYWHQGNGAATITYVGDKKNKCLLLILPSYEHGIYLKHLTIDDGRITEEWLSLEDSQKLDLCAECSNEWLASIGLFLPLEKAWVAIYDFLLTGDRSIQIDWTKPELMPEDSNW